jgi:rhodanese-related sulfurtransferase
MKKFWRLALVIALMPVLFLGSCKKDDSTDPEAVNSYPVLKQYLIDNNLDLPALMTNWIKDPKSIATGGVVDSVTSTIPAFHVFDLRSAGDFAIGHISGAINVALKDVVETAKNYTTKPILVVCYTGQTAGQAVMALRLSGRADAVVLKWGMAGWNPTFQGPWANNSGFVDPTAGNLAVGNANWVTSAAPANGTFAEPVWTATATAGADILVERVKSTLEAGLKGVAAADVLANPAGYHIINYWSSADYTTFGHFSGAYNLPVISLANDLNKTMDPSRGPLVYCYTGQTSSMVTFWLNVLGYNSKSILYGANRLVYDQLKTAGKTVYKGPKNWAVTTK